MTPAEARALFPVLERVAYLNAGTFGPLARPTIDAVQQQLRADLERGRVGMPYFERLQELRAEVRTALAELAHVEPDHVSLTGSTTDGCNIVLAGLALGPDDEIVITREEHFGLTGPVQASGARVVMADADPDAILSAVTSRTRLLALSHVLWTSGRVLPVHELRDRSGVPILVDGAQSVGAITVEARGLDFLTISGQKWLCGPDATGALVVADPERLRVARPSYFSQAAHEPSGTFEPAPGAARFDSGWIPTASLAGFLTALRLPPDWRYERAAEQARRCRELLAPHVELLPGEATLVAFRAEDPAALVARLAEADVVVREVPGTGLVRVSCGWWTDDDDLDRLVAAIAA
jgi:L-cysteine/cystine lyase